MSKFMDQLTPQHVNMQGPTPFVKHNTIEDNMHTLPLITEKAPEQPKTTEGAMKFDAAKIPVELLPTEALEEIAKVLDFGKKKYAAWNWSKGFLWSRLIGAAIRHLFAYQRGIDKDPESGLSHLAHAGCCVLFLIQHELTGLGEDDRYKGFLKNKKP